MQHLNGEPLAGRESGHRGRVYQLLELIAFLVLAFPIVILSFAWMRPEELRFTTVAWATIVQDLALVGLVLFFLWRNGEPLSAIGWRFQRPGREALIGLALFVPFFIAAGLIESLLRAAGFSAPTELPVFLIPQGGLQLLLALLFLVVVAVAEETVFRGYLILRLAAVTGSRWAAVLFSALIFAVGHGYEGSAGVITIALMGVAFAAIYLWRGSLVAPVAMHFAQNFIGIVLVPLFGPAP